MSVEKVLETLGITRDQCELQVEIDDGGEEDVICYTIWWEDYVISIVGNDIRFTCPCEDCRGYHDTYIGDKDYEKVMDLIRPPRR